MAQAARSTVSARLLLGPPDEAFDANGNFIVHPNNPNPNQAFEFSFADGSSFVVTFPDIGRAAVTGDPDQIIDFKIQTLWGIKDTAPYFHDNSARTLEEVVEHYQRFFQLINNPADFVLLTEGDKADIVAYLRCCSRLRPQFATKTLRRGRDSVVTHRRTPVAAAIAVSDGDVVLFSVAARRAGTGALDAS